MSWKNHSIKWAQVERSEDYGRKPDFHLWLYLSVMWSVASTRFVLYTARLRSCTDLYINNRLLEEAGLLLLRLCARTEPFVEMRAVWVRKLALLHESSLNTEQSWTETKYNCRLEESKREKWREWESAVIAHSDWEKVEKGQTAGAGLMLFTLFYKLKRERVKESTFNAPTRGLGIA